MYHLSVDDQYDEDAYMAPPLDRHYEEPVEMMEIGKCYLKDIDHFDDKYTDME